jgi:hypothetical protein
MTREEFGEALLRFGAKLERWPRPDAAAAKHLVAHDPVAAKMLADFSGFERTVADAVTPPPFGAAEIGSVLAALEESEESWRPSRQFWIAGVGASALSFAAGIAVMLYSVTAQGQIDLPLSMIGLAIGQADLGGVL